MTPADPCPCGLPASYAACCSPYHLGASRPPTAERLMRSRYSAFALGRVSWLMTSWDPSTRPERLHLDPRQRWTGLTVTGTTQGGLFDEAGTVSFIARYRHGRQPGELRERSQFRRVAGSWLYVGPGLEP